MNGKFIFLTTAFAVLAGCGSEKDAEYYFNNPEKLKSLLEECDAKSRNAKSQEEVEALSGNKECTTAELAKKAIEFGSVGKAILKESEGKTYWNRRVEFRFNEVIGRY